MELTAERLRESGVFVASDFCSRSACIQIRAEMDRGVSSRAQIYMDGYCVEEDVRRAFEVDVDETVVDEVQRALDTIRVQVAQFFGTPLSGEEGPGFVRYGCGGFYRVHRDVAPAHDEF